MRLYRTFASLRRTTSTKPRAVAIGVFDGVHLGHQAVISRAAALGRANHQPVGVLTFEPHPRQFFKPDLPPFRITPFRIKMRVIQALGLDFVCCLAFDRSLAGMSAQEFAEGVLRDALQVRHIVVGEDFCFGKGRSGDVSVLTRSWVSTGLLVAAIVAVVVPLAGMFRRRADAV